MSVLVVGLSHKTAPVDLLERVAIPADHVPKALNDLQAGEHVVESVVLSTCNRIEVYAHVTRFHGGVQEVSDLLSRLSGVPLEDLSDHLYVHYEERAVQHLFAVACGLDSMVVGEGQILGQVRQAFRVAQDEGSVSRVLGELMRHSLRVGKRVRTETAIGRAGASLVGIGLRVASAALGPLGPQTRALIVGAGSMGALTGASLRREGVTDIVVANRTPERGGALAATLQARATGLDDLADAIAEADIVVSSTGASGLVVEHDAVRAAVARRGERPLFLLDLALPRDVDPAVRELPGVRLADLDALRAVLDTEETGADLDECRRIVADEVAVFLAWQRSMRVAPTVVALRNKANALIAEELERLAARVPDLDARSRGEVEHAVRRLVDKLLHAPTRRVKELAESPGGDQYAEALRELFMLDPTVAEAVSSAGEVTP
ncbi:MAG TPA: glutamyl-tRNA reductase [Frankiaceae bacterium]|nr:glutamyl-tRNA reductase [Frankiaceae bacterium]